MATAVCESPQEARLVRAFLFLAVALRIPLSSPNEAIRDKTPPPYRMSARIILYDYLGQTAAFNAGGRINATVAAVRFGKVPSEWLHLDATDAPTRSCRCQAGTSPL